MGKERLPLCPKHSKLSINRCLCDHSYYSHNRKNRLADSPWASWDTKKTEPQYCCLPLPALSSVNHQQRSAESIFIGEMFAFLNECEHPHFFWFVLLSGCIYINTTRGKPARWQDCGKCHTLRCEILGAPGGSELLKDPVLDCFPDSC